MDIDALNALDTRWTFSEQAPPPPASKADKSKRFQEKRTRWWPTVVAALKESPGTWLRLGPATSYGSFGAYVAKAQKAQMEVRTIKEDDGIWMYVRAVA